MKCCTTTIVVPTDNKYLVKYLIVHALIKHNCLSAVRSNFIQFHSYHFTKYNRKVFVFSRAEFLWVVFGFWIRNTGKGKKKKIILLTRKDAIVSCYSLQNYHYITTTAIKWYEFCDCFLSLISMSVINQLAVTIQVLPFSSAVVSFHRNQRNSCT